MMKLNSIAVTGTDAPPVARRFHTPKVVSITRETLEAARRPAMPAERRQSALGRKGRRARTRKRLIDGAFITAAISTAVLMWWTA